VNRVRLKPDTTGTHIQNREPENRETRTQNPRTPEPRTQNPERRTPNAEPGLAGGLD